MGKCVRFWPKPPVRPFIPKGKKDWETEHRGIEPPPERHAERLPVQPEPSAHRLYFHKNNRLHPSPQPLPGIPHYEKSCVGNAAHHPRKLPFPPQNLWLPCMETRGAACPPDGHFQPFLLQRHQEIFRD